jgi:hypothetical protein
LRALETFWRKPETARLLKVVAVAALAYLIIFSLFPLLDGYTGPLNFAHIGQHFCCDRASKSYGYDGQFYYYIATDPLHASIHMDNASYRYQRIFYPMAVWVLSLGGNAGLAAWWLVLLNVLGALAGTAALAVLLQRRGLSPWFSLAFGLYFGQLASITHDVPDGLAVSFVVFAALAADREQWKTCALWLAIAGLTRETTLVFAAGAALNALFQKRPWRAALLLSACVPFVAWLVALRLIFGKTGLFFSDVGSLARTLPFYGLSSIVGLSPRFLLTLLVIVLPAVGALVWIAREALQQRWRAAPGWLFALLANIWLVIFLNGFAYGDLTSSSRVTIGVSLAWLLYAVARQSRALLWLAAPWALGAALYALAIIIHLQSIIV